MINQLNSALVDIATRLFNYFNQEEKNDVRFYIGKTKDIERRREEHLKEKGLAITKEIANGNPEQICEAEKFLISFFKSHSTKAKCINESGGGEGDPDANILYVSMDKLGGDASDPFDDEESLHIEGLEPVIELK